MSADQMLSYRFATDAQWNACLFARTDRDALQKGKGIRPFVPYSESETLYPSRGARAPVVTRTGEILWSDDSCALYRLTACDDAPEVYAGANRMASAGRIIAAENCLWVLSDESSPLQCYEADTLSRLLTVSVPNAQVVDIASGGHGSVLALVNRKEVNSSDIWKSVRVDHEGHVGETIDFKGISHVTEFVFLQQSQRFVVLTDDSHPRLYWFSSEGGPALFSLAVAAIRPCFAPIRLNHNVRALGSDSRDKVFLVGADGKEFGGNTYVLIFDAEGNSLGNVPIDPLDAPITGVTASRDSLIVAGQRGLLRCKFAEIVPQSAGQVECSLLTPMLYSPDLEDQHRWLRVEATASLPEGSTLEIAYAATKDPKDRTNEHEIRDRLQTIWENVRLPSSLRMQMIRNDPDLEWSEILFRGSDREPLGSDVTRSAPLFDVGGQYLWICVTLKAAPGARLPAVTELDVFYPGRSLMENLPMPYQRAAAEPGDFLRSLVGVLEATTQDLDASIAAMGSLIHPDTALGPWMDYIARWMGLPWDDALSDDQKRNILHRAADLAKGRGTRAGLEALLECLMPETPRRFRVTDVTADFGFAIVGSESCAGSALPAMLGGNTRWSPKLDSSAVLGFMRLPCAGQLEDGAWQLAGKVRIDIAATAAERKAWEPWLLALITEMVPLTTRAGLRWVAVQALRTDRLDGTLKLESAPEPHLGTDAITGLARLPERETRLSHSGATITTLLH